MYYYTGTNIRNRTRTDTIEYFVPLYCHNSKRIKTEHQSFSLMLQKRLTIQRTNTFILY